MTPKSLLRHKDAASTDRRTGQWQPSRPFIGEIDKVEAKKVTRMVTCAGRVYFDLLAARRANKIDNVALVRVEQLYPFDDRGWRKR